MIVKDAVHLITRVEHPRWLQRPTILPDELAHSYALRVLRLNAADSLKSLIATIAAEGVVDPKVTKLEFLAWIAEVDVSEFLRFHTLTPFQRAFTIDATPRGHGERRDTDFRYKALRVKVPFFRICDACKLEDLGYWGLSIIRASHHIPGVEYCEKHMQPLISTGFETHDISQIQNFSWTDVPSETTEGLGPQNEVIERYAAISTALMARSDTIPVRHVSVVIASRAKQQGLRRAMTGKRKILSDLVLDKAPKDWIDRLLPCFLSQKTTPGVFTASLDGAMNPGVICRPEAYVIALAVLYSDSDEALSQLTTPSKSPESLKTRPQRSRPNSRKSVKIHTAIEVAEAYVYTNFSNMGMAKILELSRTWIKELLVRFNLPPARLIGKERNRTALLLFKDGADLTSACASAGSSVTDLVNLLRFDLDLLVPLIRKSGINRSQVAAA